MRMGFQPASIRLLLVCSASLLLLGIWAVFLVFWPIAISDSLVHPSDPDDQLVERGAWREELLGDGSSRQVRECRRPTLFFDIIFLEEDRVGQRGGYRREHFVHRYRPWTIAFATAGVISMSAWTCYHFLKRVQRTQGM